MRRALGRALWWLLTYERPTGRPDYAALLTLLALALLGALVVGWPWLVDLVPRALAAAWALVQAGALALAERLRSALPRGG